jgi:hypothetical protein
MSFRINQLQASTALVHALAPIVSGLEIRSPGFDVLVRQCA